MKLALRDIVVDSSVDIRERLDEPTISTYMEVFDRLPPITVFETPEGMILADGFHRVSAATRLGHQEVEADVKKGTRQDALEFAASANATGGLRLTSEERRLGIRRLVGLHPEWGNSEVSSRMACNDELVRQVKRNLEVYREAPTASQLTETHVREISRAPTQQWEPLARAATAKSWTTEETREAVRNLSDPKVPTEHKQALLRGDTEPISFRGEEPTILRQTIARHLSEEAKQDYKSFLEGTLHQLAQLRRFPAQEIVDGVSADRLRSLIRELPGYVDFLNSIGTIGKSRLEIWSVDDGEDSVR